MTPHAEATTTIRAEAAEHFLAELRALCVKHGISLSSQYVGEFQDEGTELHLGPLCDEPDVLGDVYRGNWHGKDGEAIHEVESRFNVLRSTVFKLVTTTFRPSKTNLDAAFCTSVAAYLRAAGQLVLSTEELRDLRRLGRLEEALQLVDRIRQQVLPTAEIGRAHV